MKFADGIISLVGNYLFVIRFLLYIINNFCFVIDFVLSYLFMCPTSLFNYWNQTSSTNSFSISNKSFTLYLSMSFDELLKFTLTTFIYNVLLSHL